MLELTNKYRTLTLRIDTEHAEPIALIDASGENRLWKGDSEYWSKHDPILFPTIGKCFDGRIIVDGKPYPMPKHGFANQGPWQVVEHTTNDMGEDHLILEFHDNADTFTHYPFHFRVQQTFEVQNDNTLQVSWRVSSDVDLPFMMGAHPAFALPHFDPNDKVHGYLQLDIPTIESHVVQPDGYLHDETVTVDLQEDTTASTPLHPKYLLPLTNTTFQCDTLLDTRGFNREVTLLDKQLRPLVTLRHVMPVLALWAPKHGCCPFVCIEPWCGANDAPGYDGEFKDRPFLQHAAPGYDWTDSYTIHVHTLPEA